MRIENDSPEEAFYDEETTYQINTFGADFTVDGLVNRFERDDIFRPDFQRNFVWTLRQSSRFIESILLGLPIPSVFLYREEDSGRHLIVDGLQRLSTLHGFSQNRFPNTSRSFRLRNVQRRFENKTILELDLPDQRRFFDAVIHSVIIQQLAPDNDRASVFHIFERLNSNGTPLHAQEMRAAIFHGDFQSLLFELNQTPSWRLVFGPEHKRSKDQELILRFLALNEQWHDYEKPMAKFLNHFMARYRQSSSDVYAKFAKQWTLVIDRIFEALGPRAFKPRGALNVALFDAITVAVASNPELNSTEIRSAYGKLLETPDFRYWIERATSDDAVIRSRIELAIRTFSASA